MADISARITRKSLKAKRKAAIKTIKAQAKEKIREVNIEYNTNPERLKAKQAEKEHKRELRLQKANARLAYNSRQPRQFTLGEDIFNSVSHGIGAGLSVAAIVLLIIHAVVQSGDAKVVTAFTLFGSSLFILYLFSTLYHAITALTARKVFSIFNHNAIYLLLAGTVTPFIITQCSGHSSLVAFIIVWSITAFFIALYSVFGARLRNFSVFTYIVIGFAIICVFGFSPIGAKIGNFSRAMLIVGFISYAVGGVFFMMRKYKWTHCIFHMFVLAGSILHFFSVYYLV